MSVKFREHPETDPLAKKWSLRVSAARRHWDSFHRRIRHNRQLVSGLDWNRDPGQTGFYLHRANLIHSTIMGILPNIYAKNPEISVKPLHASRDLKLLCKTIETVTNRYLDDAQLKMRAKATVRAALTCSFGVLKVMYQQRIETDPLIHARIADSQDNRMRVAGLAMELEDDGNQNDKGKKEETFNFTIFKYYLKDETKTGLANAEFELYKGNTEGTAADEQAKVNIVDEGKGVYRQATADEAKATGFTSVKIVSDADGKVLVKGLDAGTYYLRETKAPEGYNKLLSDIKVEIKANYDETTGKLTSYSVDYTYNGTKTTGIAITTKDNSPEVAVENKTGAQLPSTGSKGALMVTLAGIVLFGALTASKAFGKKKANN